MTNKVGEWNIREGHTRLAADVEYAERMAKETLEGPRPPKPTLPTHFNGKPIAELSASEKEEFIISLQPVSTQGALRRDPKDDEAHWNREILNWKAVPDAKSQDEAVAKRALDPFDVSVDRRAKQGRNQHGDSEASSVDKEKRELGIQAFTYSKPAELTPEQKKSVTKLIPIVSTPFEEEKPTDSWWARIFGSRSKKIIGTSLKDLRDPE